MKIIRYGDKDKEKPAVIDDAGNWRDVSALVDDWRGATLDDKTLDAVRTQLPDTPLLKVDSARLGAPLTQVGKIICIGLNYRAHAAEAGLEPPNDPIIFIKSPTAINGPTDAIELPRGSQETDWEVELAVVIGKDGRYISEETALTHVAGYCVANDVSEREYQLRRGTQWTKGKSADTFAPIGPWLVTRDAVPTPQNLSLQLALNGDMMQSGNSADMIFSVAQLISRVSDYMSWRAGDIMLTGTPPGVGLGQKPPRFLRAGDTLDLSIDGLGEQHSRVVVAR